MTVPLSDKYRVHTISGAPRPWRVLLGLVAKQVDFELVVLEGTKKEHKKPEFLALNPRGRVPVLEDGEAVICESLAILQYLDQRHPSPPLFGTSPRESALVWQRVMEADHDVYSATAPFIGAMFSGIELDEAVRLQAEQARAELAVVSAWLGNNPFLAGAAFSAVDCVCFPQLRLLQRVNERRPEAMAELGFHPFSDLYPALALWVKRIEALPGYEKSYPPHWRA
jgi:glutathione S-transferase